MKLRELEPEEMEQVVGGATEPSAWLKLITQLPTLPEPWPRGGIVSPPKLPEERE
ncbi:MAG: hypothetical protein KatS3mg070_0214 [Meiothermus sp.]|uniref:hypothetical protein n=1 Tax=Meiothermus sp. TaxID=1955249 RepID=UPI0021DEF535|nr:hypothetical protein [Meiothermus sp.]GIW26851.1 MAG: hypothetical protein KatS3mg070_0214 [Meiothermus sp.]